MGRTPEERRTYKREWAKSKRETDPEFRDRAAAAARKYRAKPETKAKQREYQRSRYANDPEYRERVKTLNRPKNVKRQADNRRAVIEGYGGECECCHSDYEPHLTIDHIDGGGTAERRTGVTSIHLYARLRREGFPPGYRVLCWNCNWAFHRLGRCGCSDH